MNEEITQEELKSLPAELQVKVAMLQVDVDYFKKKMVYFQNIYIHQGVNYELLFSMARSYADPSNWQLDKTGAYRWIGRGNGPSMARDNLRALDARVGETDNEEVCPYCHGSNLDLDGNSGGSCTHCFNGKVK